jgi:MFS family permease
MSNQNIIDSSLDFQQEIHKNLRFNFLVNLGDSSFFGLALGITTFSAVLPLFVSSFTDSAILIGLIPSMHSLGWLLPQLFTAHMVSKQKRFKPFLLTFSIQERLPFLFLALLAFFSNRLNPQLVILFTFILLAWHGLSSGISGNPWQNLLAKVIPGENRATFFGIMNGSSNLFGSVGAFAGGLILEKYLFPSNFAFCFLLTFITMMLSWGCLAMNREPERKLETQEEATTISQWDLIKQIFKHNRSFVIFLLSRISYQFGMMALAFLTVFSVNEIKVSTITVGALTSILFIVQVASNPVLGWIADHWGRRNAFILGAFSAMLGAICAGIAHQSWLLFPAFFFIGIANSAFWTIGMAYSMEFGSDKEKPTYVGLSNTLVAPAVALSPLLGGWLAEQAGYRLTFCVSTIFALLTVFVLLTMEKKSGIKKKNRIA